MPATRHSRSRNEKAAELLAIAQHLFLERGFDGTTMAAIGAKAGVASNVVHWYFASKDELFVAALEGLLTQGLEELFEDRLAQATPAAEKKELEALLVQLVSRLIDKHGLIATVHERSSHSEVVEAFHEWAHRLYGDCLERAITRCDVPDADRELVVEALLTALEGLVMHRAAGSKVRRTISFLVDRLTTPTVRRELEPR